MIYILTGNDTKKKNAYLKKLYKDDQLISVLDGTITKEILFDQAHSLSLFGGSPVVVAEGVIKEGSIILSSSDLLILKESETTFVLLEEKILASDLKKYQKYATIEDFSIKEVKQTSKIQVFDIADSFSRKDKMSTWILYRNAVLAGISPEEISGILFWKIKTMILNGTKFFKIDELKIQSSELVSIYHRAHRGELDFIIGLEQFILSSLSK